MELVQQHGAPGFLDALAREGKAFERLRRCAPHLGLAQRELALAVAALGARLRGVGTAMGLKIQLSHIAYIGPDLCFLVPKIFQGVSNPYTGHAFQITLAAEEFEMVAGGAAAAVAPAEGKEARGKAIFLHALVPALDHRGGVGM